MAVNCAGLTETLLESELFGHVKGSFTGAYRDKRGKLQLAHRGTLFLDEVGEMSLRMQALLLRFLENGEVHAVGSDHADARVDVRVIAATNRNLTDHVAAGQFREDLFYRLSVIHLVVPPLRARPDDIQALMTHFVARSGRRLEFSEDAVRAFLGYRWPGNVRELQNVVEQLAWLSTSGVVGVDDLPASMRSGTEVMTPGHDRRRQVADTLYDAVVTQGASFWEHVYPMFLARDITRNDLRQMVRRGLRESHGRYKSLLKLFGMPGGDYRRFMNFLAARTGGVGRIPRIPDRGAARTVSKATIRMQMRRERSHAPLSDSSPRRPSTSATGRRQVVGEDVRCHAVRAESLRASARASVFDVGPGNHVRSRLQKRHQPANRKRAHTP